MWRRVWRSEQASFYLSLFSPFLFFVVVTD